MMKEVFQQNLEEQVSLQCEWRMEKEGSAESWETPQVRKLQSHPKGAQRGKVGRHEYKGQAGPGGRRGAVPTHKPCREQGRTSAH